MKKSTPMVTTEKKEIFFKALETLFEDSDNEVIIIGHAQKGGTLRFLHATTMDAIVDFGILIAELTDSGDIEVDEIIERIRFVAELAKATNEDAQKGGRAS